MGRYSADSLGPLSPALRRRFCSDFMISLAETHFLSILASLATSTEDMRSGIPKAIKVFADPHCKSLEKRESKMATYAPNVYIMSGLCVGLSNRSKLPYSLLVHAAAVGATPVRDAKM